MIQSFIERLRANFHARLERKTGWGKEELKLEFERAVSETLAKSVEGLKEMCTCTYDIRTGEIGSICAEHGDG